MTTSNDQVSEQCYLHFLPRNLEAGSEAMYCMAGEHLARKQPWAAQVLESAQSF
jgi:hypothetical protein